jgi:predicted aminopeptidase
MLKKIGIVLVFVIVIFTLINCKLISYGIGQAKGQLKILSNTVPIKDILDDPKAPDSLKKRLMFLSEIKEFAIDSLKLKDTKNYQKLYDQKGKPILWVVIASDKYELKALKWDFPIIGSFDYKGFFDYQKAVNLENELKTKGYDTEISEVAAWSTLGWFKDPILSSMLFRSDGGLADLIIHEMTHNTIFIKNNHELSENLANFIGKHGAEAFIDFKYGISSAEHVTFQERQTYLERYNHYMVKSVNKLNNLYQSDAFKSSANKDSLKLNLLTNIHLAKDSLYIGLKNISKPSISKTNIPNNSFFVGYQTYNSKQSNFETELKEKYNNNFKQYLSDLKDRYNKK